MAIGAPQSSKEQSFRLSKMRRSTKYRESPTSTSTSSEVTASPYRSKAKVRKHSAFTLPLSSEIPPEREQGLKPLFREKEITVGRNRVFGNCHEAKHETRDLALALL